jgi:hypothetical protein
MIFSGYLLNTEKTPKYFLWIERTSFFRYAFRSLVINEFSDITFKCRDSELINGICPIPTGDVILKELNFDGDTVGFNLIILFIMYLCFRIIGYGCLLLKARSSSTA